MTRLVEKGGPARRLELESPCKHFLGGSLQVSHRPVQRRVARPLSRWPDYSIAVTGTMTSMAAAYSAILSDDLKGQLTMTRQEQANLDTVRTYLAAIESGRADALVRSIFTEDARQIELPNRLNPSGQKSNLAGMLQRSEQGRKVLLSQHYNPDQAAATVHPSS
jgi:hypothetical protein